MNWKHIEDMVRLYINTRFSKNFCDSSLLNLCFKLGIQIQLFLFSNLGKQTKL